MLVNWDGMRYDRDIEMFYFVMHSTQFIIGYMEENVLFNDALNTFYYRLYGVRRMVKGHSESERKPADTTSHSSFSI